MEVTGWKALLMGSPPARGWEAESANSLAARLSGEAEPALPSHQPPVAARAPVPHSGEQAFLALPSDMRQGSDAPGFFSFFLGTSQRARSFKFMHPASHSALPAPAPKHALWGVWHQAWLS